MGTNTTNYSFSKPTVDGDEDTWGTQLNGNWDKTDSLLSGGQDISSLSITTSVTLKGQADLVLKDSDSSHSVSLQAPTTIASNYTLTMPTGDGSNGQVLTTDGSGGLSFTTITGFSGAFGDLTGKPTTITGYGITDALQLGTTATTALAGNTSIPSTLTDLGISDGTSNQVLSTDGSGSFTFVDQSGGGGNADTLDGIDSTGFVRQLSTATSPDYQTPSSRRVDPNSGNPTNEHYAITTFGNGSNVTGQIAAHFQTGQLYSRGYNNSFSSWRKIWNDANDGSGSGLDADLLDGLHASSFLRSDTTDTFTGSDFIIDNELQITNGDGTSTHFNYNNGGSQNYIRGSRLDIDVTGITSISYSGVDALNFDATTTTDSRGISFNSRTALSSDSSDGYLRLNQDSEFGNGVYTPGNFRADGATNLQGTTIIGYTGGLNSPGQLNIYRAGSPYIGWYASSTSRGAYMQYNASDYFYFGDVSYSQTVGSFRAPIFYDSDSTTYLLNPASTSYQKYHGRRAHQTGHLVGSYNNVGANSSKSNPIYTIGSSYNPNETTLGNMYGIGFTHTNASFIGFAGSSGWGMYVASDGDARVYLSGQQGSGHFTGNITAYASDERLKTNIKPVENALEKVCQLRGVEFDWVDNITSEYDFHPQTMHETGVLAQNVAEHIPDAVCEAPMNANYTAKNGTDHQFLTVDKEKIIPVLIEAIKELKAEIDMLKGEVNV